MITTLQTNAATLQTNAHKKEAAHWPPFLKNLYKRLLVDPGKTTSGRGSFSSVSMLSYVV